MGFFNAVVDNLSGRALGLAFDKKYTVDKLSSDWIDTSADARILGFNGTKAALDQRITDMVHDCGVQVHDKNWEIGTKTAESTCRAKIESKYAQLITNYTGAQAQEEANLKAVALEKNSKLIAIIVVVLAIIFATVVILRINKK